MQPFWMTVGGFYQHVNHMPFNPVLKNFSVDTLAKLVKYKDVLVTLLAIVMSKHTTNK